MEVGRSFSHDIWMEAVPVCCSELSLQILHCLGGFVGYSWPKVKNIAFQVSVPALEVSLIFELQAWFISRFLASVLIGVGVFPLFLSFRILDSFTSGGQDGFNSNIPPPFLDLSCSFVEFTFYVCRNSYGLVKMEIYIKPVLSSILDRQ